MIIDIYFHSHYSTAALKRNCYLTGDIVQWYGTCLTYARSPPKRREHSGITACTYRESEHLGGRGKRIKFNPSLTKYGEFEDSPDYMRLSLKKRNNKVSVIRQNTGMSVVYIAFILSDRSI